MTPWTKRSARADVVLDCSDNFPTRFQINASVIRQRKPLVSGAAIRFEGQLAVFGPDFSSGPCYRCLYQEADESLDSCAGNGVLGPIPGIIGTSMAADTLKILAGLPVPTDQLRLFDALGSEWRTVRIRKRKACPDCNGAA